MAELETLVRAHFSVYQSAVRGDTVTFHLVIKPGSLEADFEALRLALVPKGYIPFLAKEGGEHLLHIGRRPPRRFWSTKVNAVLLVVTIITTVYAGGLSWASYVGRPGLDAGSVANGALFFSLPLLAILGVHEMGHYVVSKRYKVNASLPFFIPSVPPLGTFGAMISMREPIPTRRALLDIGAAGPLAGLAVAVPVTLLGLFLTNLDPRPLGGNLGGTVLYHNSFLYDVLAFFIPVPEGAMRHPTLFAGWVGLFVTAMNLLPAGQLDGGHVARALLGDRAKYASYAAVGLMFVLSFVGYPGWAIIALFILLLGLRHMPPLNDLVRLDKKRILVGVVTSTVLVACFIPIPIDSVSAADGLEFRMNDITGNVTVGYTVTAAAGTMENTTFALVNTGNVLQRVTLRIEPGFREPNKTNFLFTAILFQGNLSQPLPFENESATFGLNTSEHVRVTITALLPVNASVGQEYSPTVVATSVAIIGGDAQEAAPATLTIRFRIT